MGYVLVTCTNSDTALFLSRVTWLTLCMGYVLVTCTNGDTAGVVKDGQTCSELVTSYNAECYDSAIETACCASCNSVATNDQSKQVVWNPVTASFRTI